MTTLRLIRLTALPLALALTACASKWGEHSGELIEDIPDFRSASIFDDKSTVNKLHIRLISRMTIIDQDKKRSYFLLKDHPRESTFDRSREPYKQTIAEENGASFITFIFGIDDNTATIHRRYAHVTENNKMYLHECREKTSNFLINLKNLGPQEFLKSNGNDIFNIAANSSSLTGVFEYNIDKLKIRLDFPIALINLNSDQTEHARLNDESFQIVSDQIPIYLPGSEKRCNQIVSGYIAFRSFDKVAQAVYLCEYFQGNTLHFDYGCVIDIPGRLTVIGLN